MVSSGYSVFGLGSVYRVSLIAFTAEGPQVTTHHNCRVAEIDGTLVQFTQNGKSFVVNTAAPTFAGADLPD